MPANFFKEPEEKEVKEETIEEIEKIKVGDDEYELDELQSLVTMGKFGKEVEEKQNTKLDKVYPELTKSSQRVKELEDELVEARKTPESDPSPDAPLDPLVQADKIGIVTKDNIDKFFDEKYSVRRASEKLVEDCTSLSKEIDGKDGRPAFDTTDVLTNMKETGIRSPQDAYDLMHKDQLSEWKVDKLSKAKLDGLVTESSSKAGGKTPEEVAVTAKNIDALVRESLYGPKGQ